MSTSRTMLKQRREQHLASKGSRIIRNLESTKFPMETRILDGLPEGLLRPHGASRGPSEPSLGLPRASREPPDGISNPPNIISDTVLWIVRGLAVALGIFPPSLHTSEGPMSHTNRRSQKRIPHWIWPCAMRLHRRKTNPSQDMAACHEVTRMEN